jgi:hypothetical protein
MNAGEATDSGFVRPNAAARFTGELRPSHYSRMRFHGRQLRVSVLAVLVLAAVGAATVLMLRVRLEAVAAAAPDAPQHTDGSGNAASAPAPNLRTPSNPAAQRPGPPDPVAQQSAAVSAENAAKAAADLAASTQ